MRVQYDRRGRIRGYSGGPGVYYWFEFLKIAFLLLIVVPVLVISLAIVLVCLLGAGITAMLGRDTAGWKNAASVTLRALERFGRWGDRQQR